MQVYILIGCSHILGDIKLTNQLLYQVINENTQPTSRYVNTYVTGFSKAVLNSTFSIMRNTVLKY